MNMMGKIKKKSSGRDHVDPVSALLFSLKMRQCCKETPALLNYTHGDRINGSLFSKNYQKKS